MHDCPECGSICYCDLDDSNDCRDNGECFHGCEPEDEEDAFSPWPACPACEKEGAQPGIHYPRAEHDPDADCRYHVPSPGSGDTDTKGGNRG